MDKKNFVILLASTVAAALIGSFLASLIIFNKPQDNTIIGISQLPPHMRSGHPPMPADFDDADKMIEAQEEFFDKAEDAIEHMYERRMKNARFVFVSNTGIKTVETNDAYKITVDLKPFNNDINNVKVKVRGNKAFVNAHYNNDNKNEYSMSQLQQVFLLSGKVDEKMIKKEKKGNSLVITIPKK